MKDTLLNVFLAIAVDNLATAQEMTADQEEAEALAREQKEKSAAKEATMFLPNPLMAPLGGDPTAAATDTKTPAATGGKGGAAAAKTNTAQGGKTNNTTNAAAQSNPPASPKPLPVTNTSTAPTTTTTTANKPGAKAKANSNLDVDRMITRKVDLDYIPGLDDDLKVILPGKIANIYNLEKTKLSY